MRTHICIHTHMHTHYFIREINYITLHIKNEGRGIKRQLCFNEINTKIILIKIRTERNI